MLRVKAWNRPAAFTSGRLEPAGEPGEQHLAGRHVGEAVDVASASARASPSRPPFTTRFGLRRAKSRSAFAAMTASPRGDERDRDRPLEQRRRSRRGPASSAARRARRVLEDLVLGRRRAQRGARASASSVTVRPRYSVSTAASAASSLVGSRR